MITSDGNLPVSLDDVRNAGRVLREAVARTPLLENADVNAHLGGRLLIKADYAQRTGAVKIRGAYWCIWNMSAEERRRGAITYSSGSHALGVATAARALGSSALIVMPDDAPEKKVSAVRVLKAEIVTYNRDRENYDDVVEHLRQETGHIHAPPSAHPQVLAGVGTVTLEIFEQAVDIGCRFQNVVARSATQS